jgi:hypothetical protein
MEPAIKIDTDIIAPPIQPIMPTEDIQFEALRKAIGAATLPEIDDMIIQRIIDFNTLNQFEVKRGDTITKLDDEPRHFLFPEILTAVDNALPVALIGPAGSGKSTVAEQVAKAIKLSFYLQNGVDSKYELTGFIDAQGRYHTTSFRRAFQDGGVLIVDEVDTSDAGALKWMNTALANGYALFPDNPEPVQRHKDFRIIIAANTYGNGADRVYVGANQLDASTLDRFVFIDFHYDEKLEIVLSGNQKWAERVQAIRRGAIQEKARMVVSPRASINGAKLLAAGWDQRKVEDRVIWKGIDKDLRERILKSAGVVTADANSTGNVSGIKKKR